MEEWRNGETEKIRNGDMKEYRDADMELVEESVGQVWRCEMGDSSGGIFSDQEEGESLECVEGVDDMHKALWGGGTEPLVNEKGGHVVGGEVMICACCCFVMLNVWKLKCSDDNDGFEVLGMENCCFVFGFCDTYVDLGHCYRGQKRHLSVSDVICLQVKKHGQQTLLCVYSRRWFRIYYIIY